jgi:predicted acyl esterase
MLSCKMCFIPLRKGHKIQVQVQSTWFPLIDLNPQTFVENIFYAKPEDFQNKLIKCTMILNRILLF